MLNKVGLVLRWIESALLLALFFATLGVAVFQVVARNVADTGLSEGESFVRVMVLWITMLGALVASRNDTHIRIDMLMHVLQSDAQRAVRRVAAAFTAVVLAVLAWFAARFVMFEFEDGTRAFGTVPAWWCELVMPVGFALMSARYLFHSVRPP